MKGKPKIKAWKPVVSQTAPELNLQKIESAIESIYNLNGVISYQEIYHAGYELCHSFKGNLVYAKVCDSIVKHTNLIQSLNDSNSNILENCEKMWKKNKDSLILIKGILLYVENTYVKENNLQNFYDYGTLLFKQIVYIENGLGPKVAELLVNECFKEKHGKIYDKNIIKSVIDMLIQMGLGSNSVYREIFEEKYLEASEKFYKEEAENLIGSVPISEYLKHVDKRINQEKNLCLTTIDVSTLDKILNILDNCFIVNFSTQIVGNKNVYKMVENVDIENVKLLYRLYSRPSKCIKDIANSLVDYIQTSISEVLKDTVNIKKPIVTIQKILEINEKLQFCFFEGFSRNQYLESVIKLNLESVLNISDRISIYFAIYLDNFFIKEIKSISDQNIELEIIKLMKLFLLLKSKDVFEIKHREFLASRILENKTWNIESERIVIKYLKQECGLSYVKKLEGMINDSMSVESIANDESFDVRVLTSCYWPQEKYFSIEVPQDLSNKCKNYIAKYCLKHAGRRLTWRYEYGNCHLKAYLGDSSNPYELIGSIYQGCVLLYFNTIPSISVSQILEKIKGTPKEIKKHILGLVKAKILNKTSKGKMLFETDLLQVNEKYVGKFRRVQLEIVAFEDESEKKLEENENSENVNDNRKYFIEAGIVKIMKARRSLDHANLVSEVIKLAQLRFNPDIKMIKDRVEALIEKEFIRRDQRNSGVYNYIA